LPVRGDAGQWATTFRDILVPKILRLILESWSNFTTSQQYEVDITREFHSLLVQRQDTSRLPFLILREVPLSTEGGHKELGRLDLMFIRGLRPSVYFSFECKRLRVTLPDGAFSALAGKYVTEGMNRYFNGQYASGLDKGGMLGYVMDGDTTDAIDDVSKAIEARRKVLHMTERAKLRRSSLLPSERRARETRHQYGPKGRFIIHHVFLPMESGS